MIFCKLVDNSLVTHHLESKEFLCFVQGKSTTGNQNSQHTYYQVFCCIFRSKSITSHEYICSVYYSILHLSEINFVKLGECCLQSGVICTSFHALWKSSLVQALTEYNAGYVLPMDIVFSVDQKMSAQPLLSNLQGKCKWQLMASQTQTVIVDLGTTSAFGTEEDELLFATTLK